MEFTERVMFGDAADMRITGDGYLVATPRVARVGIQLYKGFEVGRPELDDVRVYRPETEVFNQDSLHTFAHRPVTDDHPKEPVKANNWKKYAVGQTDGTIARDGDFIRVPMVLMDQAVISKVRDGKVELSVGYQAELKWGKGTTPEGEQYDAIQTGIRANHIAIVDAARGGSKLRLGDDKGVKPMNTKTIELDGVPVEMSDIASSVVLRTVKGLNETIAELKGKLERDAEKAAEEKKRLEEEEEERKKQEAEDKAAIVAKDAEIAALKQQIADAALTPEKIEALVRDRAECVAKSRAMIGDALVVDGKTEADMRRQVVLAKMGDAAKDYNDDAIKVAFDTLAKLLPQGTVKDAASKIADSFNQPAFAMGTPDARKAIYDSYDQKLSERWKGAAAS